MACLGVAGRAWCGSSGVRPDVALFNDERTEFAFSVVPRERTEKVTGSLVLMLTESKEGAWRVKDIDFRNEKRIEDPVLRAATARERAT